jgi:hypothetical protein
VQIDDLKAQIDDLRVQIDDLRVQIDDLRVQIDDLKAQIDDLRVQIDTLDQFSRSNVQIFAGANGHKPKGRLRQRPYSQSSVAFIRGIGIVLRTQVCVVSPRGAGAHHTFNVLTRARTAILAVRDLSIVMLRRIAISSLPDILNL